MCGSQTLHKETMHIRQMQMLSLTLPIKQDFEKNKGSCVLNVRQKSYVFPNLTRGEELWCCWAPPDEEQRTRSFSLLSPFPTSAFFSSPNPCSLFVMDSCSLACLLCASVEGSQESGNRLLP